ncbi:MAG: hypothetical protein HY749_06495 [Gammaproteobacteria bacterium]|nr:hypothetical protein [Gammaproteobacteria bacterium]MBI5616701.1 hypothetical protein [Gammaproteobacteria bacterium]
MNGLLENLQEFQDAIIAGVEANGGAIERRGIRWTVERPPGERGERVRLQVWRDRERVFERSFSPAQIAFWLTDPDFRHNIAIAVGTVESLRGLSPASRPAGSP